jgi:hypothetical protein
MRKGPQRVLVVSASICLLAALSAVEPTTANPAWATAGGRMTTAPQRLVVFESYMRAI